ncbi:hypothetical protein BD309DRAFT_161613 [Dichomitus squalens]|nr:hypothetical protein BD309DRAFT_161613 [Dichomitus squalens]
MSVAEEIKDVFYSHSIQSPNIGSAAIRARDPCDDVQRLRQRRSCPLCKCSSSRLFGKKTGLSAEGTQ